MIFRRRRPQHFNIRFLPQPWLLSENPVIRALQLHNLGLKTRNEVLEIIQERRDQLEVTQP